ncbi:glutathione S-transferase family protein [Aquamicrobium sp. LC103]|uniref:glutathione S-transferase family protein n=1 Tax=Aquamicrobium sp. LC103 TaxID=1120658 RepID=UPI00063E8236|nr:glutathione S-transferase family protein [Aquamicrobium sp. LC103]TKT79297.1 glutathione S-transferase family protein [Aquamicrobium sp. LC103]
MILIGQYDSSFVRRVGIALRLYDMSFEHRPWSVFGDAEKIAAYNPLTRVPTLVLDDGDVLVDSVTILDHLDNLVPADRALHPRTEPQRHQSLKIAALASGLADKAVSLFYERRLHENPSEAWEARCLKQIRGTLASLEADRARSSAPYWFGDRIGHADIAVAASIRHMSESHPDLAGLDEFPALASHCDWMERLPVFREISQPFIAPA